MKNIIPLVAILILAATPTYAQRFFANNPQSKQIFYNIIDPEAKTVEVLAHPEGEYRGSVIIPTTVIYRGETYKVVSIKGFTDESRGAFSRCEALTSVTIPNTVTTIEKGAFIDCLALTTVIVHNANATIEDSAFANCNALEKVILHNKNVKVSENSFPKTTKVVYQNE